MYRSSADAFKEFEESSIWKDILSDLEEWLEGVHETMEDPEENLTDREQAKLRGNAEAIRKFVLLPEVLHDNILAEKEGE